METKTKEFVVLLYYKYIKIENPTELVTTQKEFCEKNNLLGRILIGEEGMNGTVAGTKQATDAYINYMHSLPAFTDLWFKAQAVSHVPFKKLQIRARNEVVALKGGEFSTGETGTYLEPSEVNTMVKNQKDVVFFDVRNKIEAKVGHFEDAVQPNIEFFRELPEVIDQYENLKDKKVVLYCTGGIRCEKASVLFKKKGFKQVYQIKGGIYNYCNQFPNGHFKGTCFVFDDRMQIGFQKDAVLEQDEIPEEKIISQCDFCGTKTRRVVNDERNNGHHLVVCCEGCDKQLDISRVRFKKKNHSISEVSLG